MADKELFTRNPANPILRASDIPFPCKAVCNPAAAMVDGETLLLLRVIDPEDHSSLVVARSKNGVDGWRFDPEPLLARCTDPLWYETLGCEDARLTWIEEIQSWAVVYVGASGQGAGVCLALTNDFQTVVRQGLIIHPYNKDAVLFPKKIGGRYLMLHRPTAGPLENIWISESDDLYHWGNPRCVLEESDQPGWYSGKVGAGPPPIETPNGWLLIFHGVMHEDNGWLYRVGAALLDLEDPSKLLAKVPTWVLGPTEPYEMRGAQPGVIFPTGTTVSDGVISMYYGAADTTVALATARLDDLMAAMQKV